MHEVCILGAGPAGLNAALILGRCGRDVLVLDSGKPHSAEHLICHDDLFYSMAQRAMELIRSPRMPSYQQSPARFL